MLALRGTVEGFYGPPWSHAERLAHLAFSAQVGLNTFVYAPKDDPHHRVRWREPYPSHLLSHFAELAATARSLGIRFIYGISPALDMRFGADRDHLALMAKAQQLWDAGIDSFALLFDDVPGASAGAAHGETCARFVADFLAPRGIHEPLLVCPTDYAGTDETPYRQDFARTAPPDVLVTWTGRDVVVGTIDRDDIDRAAASYQRRLVLWDNFPVNDFDPSRLFLGPLTGRTSDLAGSPLVGLLANPMVLAEPSRIPLVSVADWALDPPGYDPAASARRALDLVAGAGAADLAPLVRACSAWPPSAVQALNSTLELEKLAQGCRSAVEPPSLVSPMQPWLDAGVAVAEAGLAAVRLLDGEAVWDEVRGKLDAAERHYANVLRSVIPPFVREVLDRSAPLPDSTTATGSSVALLLTGPRRSASDEALAELLQLHGYRVSRRTVAQPADLDEAELVVVAPGADPSAVARVEVPLVAWHGFVPLGLARRSTVLAARDRLRIVDADPLAAGLDGVVPVYRGPSRLTVAEVGPDARVVARVVEEDRPALFHYPAGARLADGTVAPAPRTGMFLADDGLAPWLMTSEGRALVSAALTRFDTSATPAPPG
jgi:hypothetical protein